MLDVRERSPPGGTPLKTTLLLLALLVLAAAPGCSHAPARTTLSADEAHARFTKLVDDVVAEEFAFMPTSGTEAGFHQYDARLEDLSRERVAAHVKTLHALLDRVVALWTEQVALSFDDRVDLEAVQWRLRAGLLEWETMGFQLQNPMTYSGLPGRTIDSLLKRDYAPAAERLKAVTARLERVPALYAAGKANVRTPPKEWTEVARVQANGTLSFLQEDVAGWAKQAAAADPIALAEYNRIAQTAIAATQDWIHFLEKELKPRSTGSWAIGADNLAAKLRYEELVADPVPDLLAKGETLLAADREAFARTAALIDRKKTPEQVLASLQDDRPTAKDLLPYVRRSLEGIRQFVVAKDLVSFPTEARPKVEPTPGFERTGGLASLDAPGAFETKAPDAYYYVTPPEPGWDKQHVDEHLAEFAGPILALTNIHEAYPGHFLQYLWAPRYPTTVRKLLTAHSNEEGWAHYGEQMMVEEGYGEADPRIKLAQLEEALLRDCRWVVGIQLHTTTLTVEQGAERFVRECYQTPANAYAEARRGTFDPTYLYYAWGKQAIYELRREYLSQRGGTLKQFHDAFLAQGVLPIPLVRKLLLEATPEPRP